MRKKTKAIIFLLLLVTALTAGCNFLGGGGREVNAGENAGENPPPNNAALVDEEGYTRVKVLAQLGEGTLEDPVGIAVNAAGHIYVSDAAAHRIYRFNSAGELVAELGGRGEGPGEFSQPGALALDAAGNLYVADVGNNRVQVLNAQGNFLRQVGSREEFSPFFSPQDAYDTPLSGLAAGPAGEIYLTLKGAYYDISENELRMYNPQGGLDLKLGSVLEGNIDLIPFTWPEALALDGEGTIYMAHGANGVGKIIVLPMKGREPVAEEILQFGNLGKGKGEFMHTPAGICVDAQGDIYVADTHNDRIQVFAPDGRWLLMFNLKGTEEGELAEPGSLTLDGEGNLYVVDRGHARILKLADPVHHGSVG
ncbi:MAG: 6-bladed beta-propeller [Firmicutes bacterium]|nr:6-bladed beta-propeller [Bacillota bacterium]